MSKTKNDNNKKLEVGKLYKYKAVSPGDYWIFRYTFTEQFDSRLTVTIREEDNKVILFLGYLETIHMGHQTSFMIFLYDDKTINLERKWEPQLACEYERVGK